MTLFQVFARYADFCGNVSYHPDCVVQAETKQQVEAVFPPRSVVGWLVVTLDVTPLPTTVQEVPDEAYYL